MAKKVIRRKEAAWNNRFLGRQTSQLPSPLSFAANCVGVALLAEDDEEEEEKEDDDDDDDQRIFYLLRLFILRSDGVRANNLDQLNGTFLPSSLSRKNICSAGLAIFRDDSLIRQKDRPHCIPKMTISYLNWLKFTPTRIFNRQ